MELNYYTKRWIMKEPFIIAGETYNHLDVVIVTLTDKNAIMGQAEACGVDYLGETTSSIISGIERVKRHITPNITTEALQELMPTGGARNAVDCALWDLRANQQRESLYTLTGIPKAKKIRTVFTIGIVEPKRAAELAFYRSNFSTLKVKAGSDGSLDNLRAVREARPDARIIIDANQSWTPELFARIEPELVNLNVEMLEQPFKVGQDESLLDYRGALKLCADESVQVTDDLHAIGGKYHAVNIKLDKTGGLTEAIHLAHTAQAAGYELMVGNMCGSSLAMRPALVVAQLCDYVDLDGPLLQEHDWAPPLKYVGDLIQGG